MKTSESEIFEKFSADELTALDSVTGGQQGVTFVNDKFSLTLGSDEDGCECDDVEEEEPEPTPSF